jgi:hypothetical protein
MPLRRSEEKLAKVTMFLFERDIARLKEAYTSRYTTYIRKLVRAHLNKRDATLAAAGESLSSEIVLGPAPAKAEEPEEILSEDDDIEVVDIGEDALDD